MQNFSSMIVVDCFLNLQKTHFKILVSWKAKKVSSYFYNRANIWSVIISLLDMKDLAVILLENIAKQKKKIYRVWGQFDDPDSQGWKSDTALGNQWGAAVPALCLRLHILGQEMEEHVILFLNDPLSHKGLGFRVPLVSRKYVIL